LRVPKAADRKEGSPMYIGIGTIVLILIIILIIWLVRRV
jgi:hypothetical protein